MLMLEEGVFFSISLSLTSDSQQNAHKIGIHWIEK